MVSGEILSSLVVLGWFPPSIDTLTQILDVWGYPLVALFIAIESSGIPFPGETMLVAASLYAGTGHMSIGWVIVCGIIGAIAGDNLGYLAGKKGGRRLVERYGGKVRIRPHHLDRAELYFQRHGDKTVFFGRHLAILRAWAAFLAGINRMPWPKFLLYNAAGAVVWVTMYAMLSYLLVHNLPVLHRILSILGVAGFVAVAAIVVIALAVWRRRTRSRSRFEELEDRELRNGSHHR